LGQPPVPHIINLSTETVHRLQLNLDITTTIILPVDRGNRLYIGSATGVINLFNKMVAEKKEAKEKKQFVREQKNQVEDHLMHYVKTHVFSDGHNHVYNLNRSIEQISENHKNLVSLGYNNTVAIWEKIEEEHGDAHSFDIVTRNAMNKDIQEYQWYQFQLSQFQARPGVAPPQPRVQLKAVDVIEQFQFNLKKEPSRSCLLKSLLFKYPPSLVYMMPSSLQVVIGLRNGKVLVWQTLNNFMLSSHTLPISHALGFNDYDDAFLITFSRLSGEFCLWNVNPTLDKTEKILRKLERVMNVYYIK